MLFPWTCSRAALIVASTALVLSLGCDGCDTQPPDINPIDGGRGIPCVVNSECGEGAYCGDDGHCVQGLPPGTCQEDTDCEGEEICVFPEDSDVGACLDPHACTDDDDCQEGQICEDADDDGYRDCIFPGCSEDAECEAELAGECTINEAARCVARACVCRDLCGAPCGEGRQCCALPDTQATCIDDPGPCWMLECEPGFAGTSDTVGDWEAPSCDYGGTSCSCAELPPLEPGAGGTPHVLRVAPDGRTFAVAYNITYGDVVVAEANTSPVVDWAHVDGVPEAGPDSPVVAGPSGPRGGIAAEGDDVGRWLDAAFTTNGVLHIVARDDTGGTLRHVYGPPDGPFTSEVLDGDGDGGYAARISLDDQDRAVVAHVVRRNASNRSVLRVLAATSPETAPASWHKYEIASFPLEQVGCEGGCVEGEVCPDPGDESTPQCLPEDDCGDCDGVCTSQGCQAAADPAPFDHSLMYDGLAVARSADDALVFAHNPRDGELVGIRSYTGDVFAGTAAFSTSTVLATPDEDVGAQPEAIRGGGGFYALATDATARRLVMVETSATLSVLSETVLDDGERTHPSGATSHHAVDHGTIALDDSQEGVIAWHDGTEGQVWGQWILAGGTLGPAMILGGAGAGSSYQGFYGFSVGAAATPTGPLISAQRVWLSAEPAVEELVMLPAPRRCPDDDAFEDNDDQASAIPLEIDTPTYGMLCADDDDYFDVDVTGACTVSAEIVFRHDQGDLDLRLLDDAGGTVDSSLTVSDNEAVSAEVAPGTYTLRVNGFSSAENGYALRVEFDCE